MSNFTELFIKLFNQLEFSIYYGVDWVAMFLTLTAIYLIGNRARSGFYLMILGNVCWVALGLLSQSIAMIIANVLFAFMNIRAIILWSDTEGE